MENQLNTPQDLAQAYAALQAKTPHLRIRQAAQKLGVAELSLLELELGGRCIRLENKPQEILANLAPLGRLMALTRNPYVVHERKGIYENVSFMGPTQQVGLVVNPDIDLRLFLSSWTHIYAVGIPKGKEVLHGLQFFDNRGEAVHKVYCTKDSNMEAYQQLLEQFRAEDQAPMAPLAYPAWEGPEASKSDVDVAAFQQDWLNLQDTHDFFGMLKRHGLARQDALRLAPEGHARQMEKAAISQMLEKASETGQPIMVFVGNKGCIQIHTGPVKRILERGTWINVMDPDFNLHLDLAGVAEAWWVRKPSADGIVSSLELFDEQGELIAYFFGARKPGIPEREDWRALLNTLPVLVQPESV